jgi:hypothetical protein
MVHLPAGHLGLNAIFVSSSGMAAGCLRRRRFTLFQIESGVTEPRRATLTVLRQAFERAGVEFIEENGKGVGVRLAPRRAKRR